jgi:exodeoxyribonuclease III
MTLDAPKTLSVATWNINSVRLRQGLVEDYLKLRQPDVLCLQETKCPVDLFPGKPFAKLGYVHQAITGQKGYNGCAILSRLPFQSQDGMEMCGRADARHVSVMLGPDAGKAAGVAIHNFYVPAGGDIADPEINDKFAHKLAFLQHMRDWGTNHRPTDGPAILVGDLNIAPCVHDVWSHKQLLSVVSHTPIETQTLDALRDDHAWIDAMRMLTPEPEKLYTWWSYRATDWLATNKGRRLDHIWISPVLGPALKSFTIDSAARGWERPSDHVPVMVNLAF